MGSDNLGTYIEYALSSVEVILQIPVSEVFDPDGRSKFPIEPFRNYFELTPGERRKLGGQDARFGDFIDGQSLLERLQDSEAWNELIHALAMHEIGFMRIFAEDKGGIIVDHVFDHLDDQTREHLDARFQLGNHDCAIYFADDVQQHFLPVFEAICNAITNKEPILDDNGDELGEYTVEMMGMLANAVVSHVKRVSSPIFAIIIN